MLAIQTQTTAGQYPKVLWDKPAGLRWPRAGIVVFAYPNSFDIQSAENCILRSSYYIIISVVRKACTHIKVCVHYYSLIFVSVLSCFGAEIISNNNSSSTSGRGSLLNVATPCRESRPWSYAYCYGYAPTNTQPCQFSQFVDIEDFM